MIDLCLSVAISSGGRHVGAGRAPSAGETSAVQTAAQRPVLHAEAPAAEETREGTLIPACGGFFFSYRSSSNPVVLHWWSVGTHIFVLNNKVMNKVIPQHLKFIPQE